MLFKIALRNMKKSLKDYTVYFLTLVLGVALFYMFNSLDGQTAMLAMTSSNLRIMDLLIRLMSGMSVFIAVVLGLLIVYANGFLIRRRKKEFGVYMMLGMGRRGVSGIILIETVFVGIFSMVVGLIIGIFGSQLMSVLTAKLFKVNLTALKFVFSSNAMIKTILYFTVMYVAALVFNTFLVSRLKLINLIYGARKNEIVIFKNPYICVTVFIAACVALGLAYARVSKGVMSMSGFNDLIPPIIAGVVSTVLVFWSLSGFILQVLQKMKRVYYNKANIFVIRQITGRMNTNVISMSVICLMLFIVISALSSAMSLRNSLQARLDKITPADVSIECLLHIEDEEDAAAKNISLPVIADVLTEVGFDLKDFKAYEEVTMYEENGLTIRDSIGDVTNDETFNYYGFMLEEQIEIMKLSDYNRLMKLFGYDTIELAEGTYAVCCDMDDIMASRNRVLKEGKALELGGQTLTPAFDTCLNNALHVEYQTTNPGVLIVPDSVAEHLIPAGKVMSAFYNADTVEETDRIERQLNPEDIDKDNILGKFYMAIGDDFAEGYGYSSNVLTRQDVYLESIGLTTIVVFIAIYLGVVFLIASAAVLSLKQLSESTDNAERYMVLRKLGASESMLNGALFKQIGSFFLAPLLLAVIHSIFGVKFGLSAVEGFTTFKASELIASILATGALIIGIYGMYFVATYLGAREIIKSRR